MALTLDIGANTRDAVKGIGQIGDALDANSDALQQLSKDAKRTSDSVSKDLKGAAKEGQRAASDLEDKFSDSMREVSRDAKRASDDVEDVGKVGFKHAGEHATEFKQEALANFSEVTSSFDGSMTSIQDLAQGTLGGLAASGLPGVGLAAGVAAVGVGLIGGAFQNVGADAEAMKQKVSDAFDDMIASGKNYISQDLVSQNLKDLVQDEGKRNEAKRIGQELDVSSGLILAAQAGDREAARAVEAAITDQIAKRKKAYEDATSAQRAADPGLEGSLTKSEVIANTIFSWSNGINTAAGQVKLYRDAVGYAKDSVDDLKKKVDGVPDSKTVTVKAVLDDAQLRAALNTIDKKVVNVKVQGVDRYGKAIF